MEPCLQSPAFNFPLISPLFVSLLRSLRYLDMVCSAVTCKHLHFCFQVLFIYGSYLLSNTHAHTPRRGQTVNQTFRHPDSSSAAMSIIGQEREKEGKHQGEECHMDRRRGRPIVCHQSVLWRGEARNISESSPKAFGDTPLIL